MVFLPRRSDKLNRWGVIWHVVGDQMSATTCQISSHRCYDKGIGPPKVKFLTIFEKNEI